MDSELALQKRPMRLPHCDASSLIMTNLLVVVWPCQLRSLSLLHAVFLRYMQDAGKRPPCSLPPAVRRLLQAPPRCLKEAKQTGDASITSHCDKSTLAGALRFAFAAAF